MLTGRQRNYEKVLFVSYWVDTFYLSRGEVSPRAAWPTSVWRINFWQNFEVICHFHAQLKFRLFILFGKIIVSFPDVTSTTTWIKLNVLNFSNHKSNTLMLTNSSHNFKLNMSSPGHPAGHNFPFLHIIPEFKNFRSSRSSRWCALNVLAQDSSELQFPPPSPPPPSNGTENH